MSPVQLPAPDHTKHPNSKIGGRHAYVEIADDLRRQIQARKLGYESAFPSHRQLASLFRVSLSTIQRAIRILVSEGILTARPDQGIFVTDQSSSRSITPTFGPRGIPAISRPISRVKSSFVGEPHLGMVVAYPPDYHSVVQSPNLRNMDIEIARGFEHAVAVEHGSTSLRNLDRQFPIPAGRISEAIEDLIATGVDGIVLITPRLFDPVVKLLDSLTNASVPIVAIEHDPVRTSLPQVYFDSRDAGRQAAEHLVSRGCRNLHYFSIAPLTERWVENRLAGVKDAALTRNCTVTIYTSDELLHYARTEDKIKSVRLALDVLAHEMPEGVIASNDAGALAFIEAAASLGKKAGEDYLILGFDDTPESQMANLTTLRPPLEDMAREAAAMLLQMIGSGRAPGRVSLNSHLIVRQSTRSLFGAAGNTA